jgi:hypothetical protein
MPEKAHGRLTAPLARADEVIEQAKVGAWARLPCLDLVEPTSRPCHFVRDSNYGTW